MTYTPLKTNYLIYYFNIKEISYHKNNTYYSNDVEDKINKLNQKKNIYKKRNTVNIKCYQSQLKFIDPSDDLFGVSLFVSVKQAKNVSIKLKLVYPFKFIGR